jgi:hypothetical protein
MRIAVLAASGRGDASAPAAPPGGSVGGTGWFRWHRRRRSPDRAVERSGPPAGAGERIQCMGAGRADVQLTHANSARDRHPYRLYLAWYMRAARRVQHSRSGSACELTGALIAADRPTGDPAGPSTAQAAIFRGRALHPGAPSRGGACSWRVPCHWHWVYYAHNRQGGPP